jgi:uncharacterized delta-60 repeat protein
VVAGWIGNTFAAARFDAAGQPDLGFGSGGLVTTPFDSYDARAQGVAIQPDGKIVVVGYTGEMSNEDFAVARYSNGRELDPEFGSGGKLTIDFFGNSDRAACIAIQADGKILVAGSAWSGRLDFVLYSIPLYGCRCRRGFVVERETGLEPATSTLGRSRSAR